MRDAELYYKYGFLIYLRKYGIPGQNLQYVAHTLGNIIR